MGGGMLEEERCCKCGKSDWYRRWNVGVICFDCLTLECERLDRVDFQSGNVRFVDERFGLLESRCQLCEDQTIVFSEFVGSARMGWKSDVSYCFDCLRLLMDWYQESFSEGLE